LLAKLFFWRNPDPGSPTPGSTPPGPAFGRRPSGGKPRRPLVRLDSMRKAYEDILWAMLASTEFLTNH
jgi:hypothetical protein